MADYDSDSSGADDVETNVLLGYASKQPTGDDFSQLGGHPTWLDGSTAPSGGLAICGACNGLMNLLLQLNSDLPDRFPGHERRLYLWACRQTACKRKIGSIRGFRATRSTPGSEKTSVKETQATSSMATSGRNTQAQTSLGETLFAAKSLSNARTNPFATETTNDVIGANPLSPASSLAAKPAPESITAASLPETFAQKARISSPAPAKVAPPIYPKKWPQRSDFPTPYPSYYIDADKEYLEAERPEVPTNARLDGEGGSTTADMKDVFESSMDKTFQRFADRLAHNPEQVLRYEYNAQPLLYSKKDAIGKSLSPPDREHPNARIQIASNESGLSTRFPKCTSCGAGRVFELQLTPHAITELEADETGIDGMEWGTLILGVCGADCQEPGKGAGEVSYVEEWVGVQWEEITDKRRP